MQSWVYYTFKGNLYSLYSLNKPYGSPLFTGALLIAQVFLRFSIKDKPIIFYIWPEKNDASD